MPATSRVLKAWTSECGRNATQFPGREKHCRMGPYLAGLLPKHITRRGP